MLYLVATPIGNLQDISLRAIEVLKSSDLILCEDTRHSKRLLHHYGIQVPLQSHHRFNEKKTVPELLERLKAHATISFISDAGTPCINDPGHILVEACIEYQIPFTAIPGACSPIQALLLSGFSSSVFQFVGFIPKEKTDGFIKKLLCYPGTSLAFEGPSRLIKTLRIFERLAPSRPIALLREMTKTFEEVLRGVPLELIRHLEKNAPKGEFVLAVPEGKIPDDLSLQETVEILQGLHGLSLKEAISIAARLKKIPKKELYREIHHTSE